MKWPLHWGFQNKGSLGSSFDQWMSPLPQNRQILQFPVNKYRATGIGWLYFITSYCMDGQCVDDVIALYLTSLQVWWQGQVLSSDITWLIHEAVVELARLQTGALSKLGMSMYKGWKQPQSQEIEDRTQNLLHCWKKIMYYSYGKMERYIYCKCIGSWNQDWVSIVGIVPVCVAFGVIWVFLSGESNLYIIKINIVNQSSNS